VVLMAFLVVTQAICSLRCLGDNILPQFPAIFWLSFPGTNEKSLQRRLAFIP